MNLDKIQQFCLKYQERRRKLAACLLVFRDASDAEERRILSYWIEQHRSWLKDHEDTYNKMKAFYNEHGGSSR